LLSKSVHSNVLTNYKPKTHQRRNDQKDIRNDGIPLLPTSQSDANSQADQSVCESEQYPFRGLSVTSETHSLKSCGETDHNGLAGDPHGEACVTSSSEPEDSMGKARTSYSKA
jgi:hypothetical protein